MEIMKRSRIGEVTNCFRSGVGSFNKMSVQLVSLTFISFMRLWTDNHADNGGVQVILFATRLFIRGRKSAINYTTFSGDRIPI